MRKLILGSIVSSLLVLTGCSDSDSSSGVSTTTSIQELNSSIVASNRLLGYSVDVSGDYIIGGMLSGEAASLFKLDATDVESSEVKLTSDTSSSTQFGTQVAINSTYAIVGARNYGTGGVLPGAVFLYELNATDINSSQTKLTAEDPAHQDFFGGNSGKGLDIDDNYALVGASGNDDGGSYAGSAYLFELNATDINASQIKLTAKYPLIKAYFGSSTSIDGNFSIVGAKGHTPSKVQGAAYLFELNATDINASQVKLTAMDGNGTDQFGKDVFIKDNYAVVGASGINSSAGATYLFKLNATDINASQIKLTASDDNASDEFGQSVAISGNYLYVGASKDGEKGSQAGAMYRFNLTASDINGSQEKIFSENPDASNKFGYSLGADDDTVVIGETGANSSDGTLNYVQY
ncbi:MAG: FG-GAP repeat protein [Campylobacterales bacterium]|nr:FG-GAP repeat protein [Campylobacterales bacterium]